MATRSTATARTSGTVRRSGGVLAESAMVIARVVLWFAAITCALVLAGLGYAFFSGTRAKFNVNAIPAWFVSLSREQWIGLGAGVVVALLLIALPCSKIAVRADPDKPSSPARRIVGILGVFFVLFLYGAGAKAAYDVSRALGHPRDWAIIHGLYSWVYVGFSFIGWMGGHTKQPLGKTLRQFLAMVK